MSQKEGVSYDADGILRTLIEPIARKIERTGALPKTMTVPMCPDRWLADKLFHGRVRLLPDGRMRVEFFGVTAMVDYWRPYFDRLGISCARKPDEGEARREQTTLMLKRLELQFPEARAALANLRDAWTANSSILDWPRASELLKGILRRFLCSANNPATTTLSQLGSDLLNDSKALRDGRGRALLGLVLGAMEKESEADERELFNRYGIVENPYTTFVTCHVPFEFELGGARFDFPRRMFEQGVAVTVPLEMVERMTTVSLTEVAVIKTSENAAPFHRMVAAHEVCVYTEGYPNSAVKRLLVLFAKCGARAVHYGDTDLDGYRIATEVGRVIPISLPPLPDNLPRKPLSPDARNRLLAFIKTHEDFPYLPELRQTLESGWVEQEKIDCSFASPQSRL